MGIWGDKDLPVNPNYSHEKTPKDYGVAAKALIVAKKTADSRGQLDYGTFDVDLSASFEAPHVTAASYEAAPPGGGGGGGSLVTSLCSSTQSIIPSELGLSDECIRLEQMVVNHDLQENNREHCHSHNKFCRQLSARVRKEMTSLSRANSRYASRAGSMVGSRYASRANSMAGSRYASLAGSLTGSYAAAGSVRSLYTTSLLNFDFEHFMLSERKADYERSICCAFHLNKVRLVSVTVQQHAPFD